MTHEGGDPRWNCTRDSWRSRRGFWKGGARYYDEHLAPECVMVFAGPLGVMEREAIRESISDSQRWADVRLTTPIVLKIDQTAVLLTYLAAARREGDERAERVYASSLYVREDEEWKLAFHQQTPG